MFAEREMATKSKVPYEEVGLPEIEEFPEFTENDGIRDRESEPLYTVPSYGLPQYGVIKTQKQESPRYYAGASSPNSPSLELADRVVFFVPGEEYGLEIYDQSPTGPEAKFAGSLPDGKFYASGMEVVKFDPKEHNEEFSIVRYIDGQYVQHVIMVDEETFLKIAMQGIFQKPPTNPLKSHYFVVDMNDTERPLRKEICSALCMDESLDSEKKEILDAAISSAEQVIKDVVLGNGKGQK